MSLLALLVVALLPPCFAADDNQSHCALSLAIQVKNTSNGVPTRHPLRFFASYNASCSVQNGTAYYRIQPLDTLVIGNETDDEDTAMIEVHTNPFAFSINRSSTMRLCVLPTGESDRLCRQVHIGITELHNFWNLPMKVFYIFWICFLGVYHILLWLRNKWRKSGKKPKSRSVVIRSPPPGEPKHDTFENEKVNEEVSGDEDDG